MTNERFSWAPLYQELADKLVAWEDRQPELIALLEQIREKGFRVTPLNDRDESGEHFLVKEIDPFTFFGTFNRGIREEQRIGILTELKKHFECEAPLPADFLGIPILNNQQSWFIAYQFRRKREDVSRLWRVFRLALSNEPMDQDEFGGAFDQALTVWGVNVNLTMGLFWIRPNQFISLDGTNRSYLGLDLKPGLSFKFYDETLKSIRERDDRSFPEISYAAYLDATAEDKKDAAEKKVVVSDKESYWFVGAYWSDREPKDQTQEFMDEGVWKNGYTDRYLDDVKQMKVGERIAIKAVSTQKKNLWPSPKLCTSLNERI